MRTISWLHISDIHVSIRDAWSQDVVLTAMCERTLRLRSACDAPDFILVTGDIAFSGQASEYDLAVQFLDALVAASGVPKERIFCIPGNHDIDRERQTLAFLGGRGFLQDQNRIDALSSEELETLLKRQQNYRAFQLSYFPNQQKTWTKDGLAYVSHLTIDLVRLAIVGMDSAWLAEGGIQDHGKLLIGERQVINALKLAQEHDDPPHIVVGMAHHPLHLLREFDRLPVQGRVERTCHFFHCGHLHAPEARPTGQGGGGCLTLASGASFETRQSQNAFSLVTLDLIGAKRTIRTFHYDPSAGSFTKESSDEFGFEVAPSGSCAVAELANALRTREERLAGYAHYFAALLLDQKGDFVIPAAKGYAFGSFAVLQLQPDSDIKRSTSKLMAFRNILRVLYKRLPLAEILQRYGDGILEYLLVLERISKEDPKLKARLDQQETDARSLSDAEPPASFSHTIALLDDLAAEGEWESLREQAERHQESHDPVVAVKATRMLAYALAHSHEPDDKKAAIAIYKLLVKYAEEISDFGNLATLLAESGSAEESKAVLLLAIGTFTPNRLDYFRQIAQKIIEATGDRSFRDQIEVAITDREKHE